MLVSLPPLLRSPGELSYVFLAVWILIERHPAWNLIQRRVPSAEMANGIRSTIFQWKHRPLFIWPDIHRKFKWISGKQAAAEPTLSQSSIKRTRSWNCPIPKRNCIEVLKNGSPLVTYIPPFPREPCSFPVREIPSNYSAFIYFALPPHVDHPPIL